MVQNLQHVVVISNLAVTGRIFVVWMSLWDFVEHRVEVHKDSRIVLNEVLKVLQDWSKLPRVLLGIFDLIIKPFSMNTIVCWKPSTCSVVGS